MRILDHVLAIAVSASCGFGTAVRAQDGDAGAVPTITIVGASVSAGFVDPMPRPDGSRNSTVGLRAIVKALWGDREVRVRDRSDLLTFLDPLGKQQTRIGLAKKDEPDLLIALDYAFWFGYGRFAGPADQVATARIGRLDAGLAMLDGFRCPILLGELPDMRGADPRMLSAQQIPDADVLARLNARLHGWASARDNVRVFPLAEWVARAKVDGETLAVRGDEVAYPDAGQAAGDGAPADGGEGETPAQRRVRVPPNAMLQGDRLHATRLGMALLGYRLAGELRALLGDEHVLAPFADLKSMIAAAGAGDELDELVAVGSVGGKGR